MDITKVQAAITVARTEIGKVYDTTLDAAKKGNAAELKGVISLNRADGALQSAAEYVATAERRSKPREKKAKKSKKAAAM